jgi:hypothetical protein
MSALDDADFFPTNGDVFESPDDNGESSDSDQETLEEVATRKHAEAAATLKKRNGNLTKPSQPPKKKSQKKTGDTVSARSRSVSFGVEELLLVARAFMKVSQNAKHSTDKKADKFWDEVYVTFVEFVSTANSVNESNPDFISIESGRGAESIRNCW